MSGIKLMIFTGEIHFGVVILISLLAGISTAIVSFVLISSALTKKNTKDERKESE